MITFTPSDELEKKYPNPNFSFDLEMNVFSIRWGVSVTVLRVEAAEPQGF